MLKAMKQKWMDKRDQLARQTEERIQGYNTDLQVQMRQRRENDDWTDDLLNKDIEKYLYTIHPSFLLNDRVNRALYNRLLARAQGKYSLTLSVTSEMKLALDFYNTDLAVFLRLIEKKGFQLQGNEERFLLTLMNRLSENNYRMYKERYSELDAHNASLSDAVTSYLQQVPRAYQLETGRLDFFYKFLISEGLLPAGTTKKKLKKVIKSSNKKRAGDHQLERMERRLDRIG